MEFSLLFGYGLGVYDAISLVLQYLVIFLITLLFWFTVTMISFSLTWERMWLDAQGLVKQSSNISVEVQQNVPLLA